MSAFIEEHPFGDFIPAHPRYVWVGSFPGKEFSAIARDEIPEEGWYYGQKVNQFWPILEIVYERELKLKAQKRALCEALGMALTDIIYSARRDRDNNLDENLVDLTFNAPAILGILERYPIEKIFINSHLVQARFRRLVKTDIPCFLLPSPSPRNARISKAQKAEIYKAILPKLGE